MSADKLRSIYSWFHQISAHSAARQFSFLLGLAGSVALGVWLVMWIQQPSLVPLYGNLSAADTEAVMQQLEQNGAEFRFDARSGVIQVAPDKVHPLRMQLASAGLPQAEGRGFEMLYQPAELGLSSFIEKARYDRALEQELARSIASMASVKSARVHLAIPEVSGYLRDRSQAEASVLIAMNSGMQLADAQVMGIQYLVASSVPDLPAEKVSVIDGQGRLLSARDQHLMLGAGQDRFQMARQLEQHYMERILDLLSPLVGAHGVRTQVAVELDFTSVETTAESYSPEAAVRSEQISQQRSTNTPSGGIPGTLANQPPEEAVLIEGAANNTAGVGEPANSSSSEVRNYELDRTVSYTREVPGSVSRVSVAVVLDYVEQVDEQGVVQRAPLPEAQVDQVRALVREAVGFNAARGDSINVVNSSFLPPMELEPLPAPPIWEQPWIWHGARTLAASSLLLLIFLSLVRPLLKAGQVVRLPAEGHESANPAALESRSTPELSQQGGALQTDDRVTLGNHPRALASVPYEQQLLMARSLAEDQPQRVAQVVRNWVAADG